MKLRKTESVCLAEKLANLAMERFLGTDVTWKSQQITTQKVGQNGLKIILKSGYVSTNEPVRTRKCGGVEITVELFQHNGNTVEWRVIKIRGVYTAVAGTKLPAGNTFLYFCAPGDFENHVLSLREG